MTKKYVNKSTMKNVPKKLKKNVKLSMIQSRKEYVPMSQENPNVPMLLMKNVKLLKKKNVVKRR